MDFVLPPPKAYQHPEMDFYVNFYNYSSIGLIMGWNGHDEALAWKQLEATLADCVKHGQTMHWLRGGICDETDRTLDIMQKVGMRTDVITGGCGAWNWGGRREGKPAVEPHRAREMGGGLLRPQARPPQRLHRLRRRAGLRVARAEPLGLRHLAEGGLQVHHRRAERHLLEGRLRLSGN